MSTKITKQFPSLIVDLLEKNYNWCLTEGTFPNDFKKAAAHATHKNIAKLRNQTTDQLASCRISEKFMRDSYMTKHTCTLIHFFLNTSVAFERAITPNIAS